VADLRRLIRDIRERLDQEMLRYAEAQERQMQLQMAQMPPSSPPPIFFPSHPFGSNAFGPIFPDREIPKPPPALDRKKLNALKKAEPHRVYQKAPDRISVITAWRAWGVDGLRLKALGQKTVWEPRKQVDAACTPGMLASKGHPAPSFDCQCGVWAFKSLDNLVGALTSNYSNVRVLGQVSLWGRVIETENGYRSQHAYPSELWLLDNSLEELGYIYDVPVRTC
jgi:hypothetical protein